MFNFLFLVIMFKPEPADTLLMIDRDDPMNALFPNFPNNKIEQSPLSDSKSNQAAELLINPSNKTQSYPKGKEFGLICEGRAEDTGRISDLKWVGPKGEIVEGSSGSVEVYRRGNALHLMFKNPSADDSGMYNCTALHYTIENMHTGVEVIVYLPPEIIDLEHAIVAAEGYETTFHCQANGLPKPVYAWLDSNMKDLTFVEGYIVDADTGTLTISNVTKEHEGVYICVAKNPAGESRRKSELYVIGSDQAAGLEISSTDETQNQSAGKCFSLTYLLIVGSTILQIELKNYMLV